MSLIQTLIKRGRAVLREWHDNEGVNPVNQRMIAELTAMSLFAVADQEQMQKWSKQEIEDKTNTLRIALTSAFQIGRHTAPLTSVQVN